MVNTSGNISNELSDKVVPAPGHSKDDSSETGFLLSATIATSQADASGDRFTPECLEALDGKVVPITTMPGDAESIIGQAKLDFDATGKLGATLSVRGRLALDGLYIVPSGIIKRSHMEGETQVIDAMELTGCFFTRFPADPHITPIESKP
jgi:hypothetical protein